MKILLFIWYAYATGMHFGTHFEILGGTLFGTQFTEKSTLGPEKYLVTLTWVNPHFCELATFFHRSLALSMPIHRNF